MLHDSDDVLAYVGELTFIMTRVPCCVSRGIMKLPFKRDYFDVFFF